MIITPKKLLDRIKAGEIIKNLSLRELESPEGVGFDLSLAALYSVGDGSGSLRVKKRRTPDAVLQSADGTVLRLMPNTSYLATTTEHFSLPSDLCAIFFPRSTLFRSGVVFQSSVLPPGYDGPMTFALSNLHSVPFEIEIGARFCHVVLMDVSDGASSYRGQWQGGRIVQISDEEQI